MSYILRHGRLYDLSSYDMDDYNIYVYYVTLNLYNSSRNVNDAWKIFDFPSSIRRRRSSDNKQRVASRSPQMLGFPSKTFYHQFLPQVHVAVRFDAQTQSLKGLEK